jgi:hypothetical protein
MRQIKLSTAVKWVSLPPEVFSRKFKKIPTEDVRFCVLETCCRGVWVQVHASKTGRAPLLACLVDLNDPPKRRPWPTGPLDMPVHTLLSSKSEIAAFKTGLTKNHAVVNRLRESEVCLTYAINLRSSVCECDTSG